MKLFIFGSTGDLFRKKISKSIENIENLDIYALGRGDLSTEKYIENNLENSSEKLKRKIIYLQVDFDDYIVSCEKCADYFSKEDINHFYIALPPEKIMETLNYIKTIMNNGHSVKILIEKPLGKNINEANKIKRFIDDNRLNDDVYLADHYLFKEVILKNTFSKNIKKISLKSLEKIGIEKRIYYDSIGALDDMIQSHFLNILIKIVGKNNLEKISILDVKIGQYNEYEKEIERKSDTETYVKILAKINDIEIEMETGKKCELKESSIKIDNEKYLLSEGKDAYQEMIERFLKNNKNDFPIVDDAILTWKITNKIREKFKELKKY